MVPFGVGLLLLLAILIAAPASRRLNLARPVVVSLTAASDILDPHLHNETVLWSLLANFYEGLTAFDRELRVVPALAEEWKTLDEHRTRFRLRSGVRFHDGVPVTSSDVKASLDRARSHPRSGVGHHLVDVEEVLTDGLDAVVVRTSGPAATLVNRLVLVSIVPERLAKMEEIREPVGTGPYRFVRRSGDGTVLARAVKGQEPRPPVRSVHFRLGGTVEERMALLTGGGADVVTRLPDDWVHEVERHPAIRVLQQPRLSVQFLAVVPSAAPEPVAKWLSDPRVRRAFLMGLNRREMVDRGYLGSGTVASQFVHPVVFGYDSSLVPAPFDPHEAHRLLRDAGLPPDYELVLGHGDVTPVVIELIVRNLAALGVRIRPVQLHFSELLQRAHNNELPLVLFASAATTGDASEFLTVTLATPRAQAGWGCENFLGYSNPEIDRMLELAEFEADSDVRRKILQEVQRLAMEDVPLLPLTIRYGHMAVSSRIDLSPRYDQWLLASEFRWR
jgi:peptide/nickel transport system substrate-binding protein